MMKPNNRLVFGLASFLCLILFAQILWAGQDTTWYKNMENRLGGYLRFQGSIAGYDKGSYFEPVGTDTGIDGFANARFMDTLALSDHAYFEIHYEAFSQWGDTHEKWQALQKGAAPFPGGLMSDTSNIDKRRLLDLTKTLNQTDEYVLWHRLDRLFFSMKASWGDVIAGRQAITWGNGLVFNPMDLFNPFSPSDTIRDYKQGDDLVSVRFNPEQGGEFNIIYVPRRNVITKDVDFKSASLAGKFHFFINDSEMDIMAALHYDEIVLGLGSTGNLGEAAWRCDLVWSTLEDENGYFEFVANIDYSWVWLKKNMYGLIEYYHNGLGENNYTNAMADPIVLERLDRGELFVLGKDYVSAQIQMELHPLLSVYLGVINNVRDPSGMIQPRAVWNLTQNSNLHLGASVYYGKKDSEYGGFLIPGTNYYTNAAANAYLMFTYYF
jgi:hypothetical protein